jgi:hypothetical protein
MKILTPEIAKVAIQKKKSKKGYLNYLSDQLDCSREEAAEALENYNSSKSKAKTSSKSIYTDMKTYKINTVTGDYLFDLKSTGKTEVFPKEIIQAILTGYSNFAGGGLTINQLSRVHKIPRIILKELKTKLGITHDVPPLLKEDIYNKNEEELLEYLALQKEFNVLRKFEAKEWEETAQEASKYRQIEQGKVNPFLQAVKSFDPNSLPTIKPSPYKATASSEDFKDDVMVISISDLHYGLSAKAEDLFYGEEFNTEVLCKFVEQYFSNIKLYLANRKTPITKAIIVSCGDILHSLTGETMNHTKLKNETFGIDQFRDALASLTVFIQGALDTFKEVAVYSMNGNHAGFNDGILFMALANNFRDEKRIKFDISEKLMNSFVVDNTYILITHGASARTKHLIPQRDPHRENFFVKAINHDAHRGIQAKESVVIQGDQHHLERRDYGSFEFVMLPSTIAGCEFADHKGFNTKPKQVCFVLDSVNGGIKEQLDFRFN